jgi:hypothetical protein
MVKIRLYIIKDDFPHYFQNAAFYAVLWIRIRMFVGLLGPDPLVRDTAPDPDTIIKQKSKKNLDSYCFVTSL